MPAPLLAAAVIFAALAALWLVLALVAVRHRRWGRMSGGVVLTQCKNVLRGDRLVVDMTTGVSRVESDTRVQALFIQGSEGCGGPSKGGAPAPPPGIPSLIPGKQK